MSLKDILDNGIKYQDAQGGIDLNSQEYIAQRAQEILDQKKLQEDQQRKEKEAYLSSSASSISTPLTTSSTAKKTLDIWAGKEKAPSTLGTIGKNVLYGAAKGIDALAHPADAIENTYNRLQYSSAQSGLGTNKEKIENAASGVSATTLTDLLQAENKIKNSEIKSDMWYEEGAKDAKENAQHTIWSDKIQDKMSDVETDTALLGDTAQFFAGLAQSVGAMAPSIAAGLVTGGASTALGAAQSAAEVAGSAAGLGVMWAEVYNRELTDLNKQGYEWTAATDKAFLDATVEVATEAFVGGTPGMRAGIFDNAIAEPISKAVTAMTSKFGNKLAAKAGKEATGTFISAASAGVANMFTNGTFGDFFAEALGEGAEEMASALIEPYVDRLTINPDADPATVGDVLLQGLGGALIGSFFNLTSLSFQKATEQNKAVVSNGQGGYKLLPASELTQEQLDLPKGDLKYLNGPQVTVGEDGVMYGTGTVDESIPEEIGGGNNVNAGTTQSAIPVQVQGVEGESFKAYKIGKDYFIDKQGKVRVEDGATIFNRDGSKKSIYRWSKETAKQSNKSNNKSTKNTKQSEKAANQSTMTAKKQEVTTAPKEDLNTSGVSDETFEKAKEYIEGITKNQAGTTETVVTETTPNSETQTETTPNSETQTEAMETVSESETNNHVGYIDVNQPDAVYRNNVRAAVIMINKLIDSGVFDERLGELLGLSPETFNAWSQITSDNSITRIVGLHKGYYPNKGLYYTDTLTLEDVNAYLAKQVIPAFVAMQFDATNNPESGANFWDEKRRGDKPLVRVKTKINGVNVTVPMLEDEYVLHATKNGRVTEEKARQDFNKKYDAQRKKLRTYVDKLSKTLNQFGIYAKISHRNIAEDASFRGIKGYAEILINPNTNNNSYATAVSIAHELIHAIQHLERFGNYDTRNWINTNGTKNSVDKLKSFREHYTKALQDLGVDVDSWKDEWSKVYSNTNKNIVEAAKKYTSDKAEQEAYIKYRQENEYEANILSSILQSPEALFKLMQTESGREGLYPALVGFINGLINQETEPEVINEEKEVVNRIKRAKKDADKVVNGQDIEIGTVEEQPKEVIEEVFAPKKKKSDTKESTKKQTKKNTPKSQTISQEYEIELGEDSPLSGLKMQYNESESRVEIIRPKDGTPRSVRREQNKELHRLGFVPTKVPKLDVSGNPMVNDVGEVLYDYGDIWYSKANPSLVWDNLGGPDIGLNGETKTIDKAKTKTKTKTKEKVDEKANEPTRKEARRQAQKFKKGIIGKLKQYEVTGSGTMTKMLSDINGRDEIWISPNGVRLNAKQKEDLDIMGFTYDRSYKVYKAKYDSDLWEATGGDHTLAELKKANVDYEKSLKSNGENFGEGIGPETSNELILVKYKGDPEYYSYGAATYKGFIETVKENLTDGVDIEIESIVDKTTGDEIFNSKNPKNYIKPNDFYDVKLTKPYKYFSDGSRANINPGNYTDEAYQNYLRRKQKEITDNPKELQNYNPEGFVDKEVKSYKMTPEELIEWKRKYGIINSEFVINNPEILETNNPAILQTLLDEYFNGGYDDVGLAYSPVLESNSIIDDVWEQQGDTYGVQDETTGTPNRPDSERINSKIAGHTMQAEDMTPELRQQLMRSIEAGNVSYRELPNSEVEKKARSWMGRKEFRNENGNFNLAKALANFMPRAEEGLRSAEEVAQGLLLWGQFRNLAQQRKAQGKSLSDAELIAFDKLMTVMAVNAHSLGAAVQFFRNMNDMTGDGRVYYMEQYFEAFRRELKEKTNIFERKAANSLDDYVIPEELLQALRGATTEEEVFAAEEAIKDDIASQIPPTIGSRITAWRYLSMLGNARTHERNIISNAAMWLARNIRDVGNAAIEDVFLSKDEYTRNNTLKRASAEVKALAKQQWELHKKEIQEGGKLGFNADIMQRAKQFGPSVFGKGVEGLSRGNSTLLELEDSWFLKATFNEVFAQYVTANESRWLKNAPAGMTVEQFLSTASTNAQAAEALNETLSKAIKEAKRATYREASDLSSWLNHQANKGGAQKIIIEGIMPFKRTPINILKQGARYSPIGIVNGITQLVQVAKGQQIIDKSTGYPKTIADCISDMCAGMTGTMIMGLGLFLGASGAMKAGGSDSDREEYYDQMLGNQKYSVNILGTNVTLDWLTPLSMPLFAGVTLADSFFNDDVAGDDDTNAMSKLNNVLSALSNMTDPFTNLSLLSGVNEALNSYSDDKLGEAATSAASSYVSQYIPTLAGQVARSIDDVRRTTYAEKDVDMLGGQKAAKFINKLKAKIPFLSQTNEEYVDMWGRTEESGGFISQGLTPWYAKKSNTTEVDDKLAEVFATTKDNSVLPATPQSYYTISEEKYYLDPEDYTQVKKTTGTLSYNGVNEVFNSNLYDQLSSDQQADAIKAVYDYAKEVAKYEYTSRNDISYDKKSTITNVDRALTLGMTVGDYFVIKQLLSDDAAGTKNAQKKAVGKGLGLSNNQIDIFLKH